jgi:uncharacterized protein HemX
MMVDLKYVLYVMLSFFTIGAAIVKFFQMQTKQNMEIQQMKEQQDEQKHKMSEQSKYQIQTEKNIIEINGNIKNLDKNMTMVIEMVKELKDQGCGRCSDKT